MYSDQATQTFTSAITHSPTITDRSVGPRRPARSSGRGEDALFWWPIMPTIQAIYRSGVGAILVIARRSHASESPGEATPPFPKRSQRSRSLPSYENR
jgi:hypothetical protein